MKQFATLVLLLLAATARAQDNIISLPNSFINGEQYMGLSEGERGSYAMGLADGMLGAPLFEAPIDGVMRLHKCLEDMTQFEIAALFTKYLNDHPEQWNQDMHIVAYGALNPVCRLRR